MKKWGGRSETGVEVPNRGGRKVKWVGSDAETLVDFWGCVLEIPIFTPYCEGR